MKQTFNTNSEK